jgi:hypothetical protein
MTNDSSREYRVKRVVFFKAEIAILEINYFITN